MKANVFHYRRLTQQFQKISPPPADVERLDREAAILQYAPLIKYIAHRLAMRLPPHISIEDLVSAGVLGLMDALDKYDPKKKVQFKTYAEFRIRGAMLDELRSLDWVPRSIRQKSTQLEKTLARLEKDKGGAVEDEEVASEMGLSLEAYYDLLNEIKGVSLLDLEEIHQKLSDLSEEDPLGFFEDEPDHDPLEKLRVEELKGILARAIETLSPKEQQVLSLYYYEELTLKEIGEVLGYTESRICQIHGKAILKLRAKLRAYWEDGPNP